ncbi:MAG: DUF2180 family protein [Archaeoglobus sp.]|nr:DUF2180 family protein [Archaeoglobus sp.]
MKCYICKEQGKDTDAVAICIVCGMGLCVNHLVREEIEIWEGGYPFPARKLEKTIPRILCPMCYETYKK